MVDIESLGNGKSCCIIQIGACYFDRFTGEIGKTFSVNIDAASAMQSGAQMDAATVYWWLGQSDAARASILATPKLPIEDAMKAFTGFIESGPASCVWSHATFDFVAIAETYKRLKDVPMPKNFYHMARDLRTLVDLGRVTVDKEKRTGLHHNGLDDALHQVKYAVKSFNNIRNVKAMSAILQKLGDNNE
jgi:hypothetical protein